MAQHILAYDFGTGGIKASLYDVEGTCLAERFASYETRYPRAGWHEQSPMTWWQAVVESTNALLAGADVDRGEIACCGLSGHSLGVVPIDEAGRLVREYTPIWSDSRPDRQVPEFFQKVPEPTWYGLTGNGFPPSLYSVFKIMWLRDHEPEVFGRIDKVIGTKDFINFKMTGRAVTDYSYASGSGVYDLLAWDYSDELIAASGLPREIFPDVVPSTEVIGELTAEAAEALGLPRSVRVVAGGVDNSCMALGARSFREGRAYNSLGSSSWIAVASERPLLDEASRPYVFAHVVPGMFTSAVGVFSTGSSFRWVREQLCKDLEARAEREGGDVYDLMGARAAEAGLGAHKLLFNPSLAGGSSLDASQNIRGAFLGLDLGHTQADVIRAAMEGIAMSLRLALDAIRKLTTLGGEMVVVGGGSRSELWRQITADLYGMDIVKTNVDQQAAALGAAAVAAVGAGLWKDFSKLDDIHQVQSISRPVAANQRAYEKLLPIFVRAGEFQSRLGDLLAEVDL